MIPTERTQLSWILKNSEKQENRENGFYLYFLFFTVFLKRITYAAPPVPARQLLPLRNCLAGAGGGVEIRWQMCVRIVEGRGRGWPVT